MIINTSTKNTILQFLLFFYLIVNKYLFIQASYLVGLCLLILTFILFPIKVNKIVFKIAIGLFSIVIIGFISGLLNFYSLKDFIKDIVYFLKPLIILLTVYNLVVNNSKEDTFPRMLVYFATLTSFIHIIGVLIFIPQIGFSVSELRKYLGLGNNIEVIAFIFLLIKDKSSPIYIDIKNKFWIKLMMITSIIFYFSRTDLILLLLLFISIKGYYRPRISTFKFIFTFLVSTLIFFYGISLIKVSYKDQNGVSAFIYKIQNTPNEIFQSKIDKNNLKDLWHNWRAYEASMAITQTSENNNQIIGNGFGNLIDLKVKVDLGEKIRRIPILHNGYTYIYFKTGFVGLIIYLVTFISIFIFGFINRNTHPTILYLISGLALGILFTTTVITGIYNASDLLLFYLAGILALYHRNTINIHQDIEH